MTLKTSARANKTSEPNDAMAKAVLQRKCACGQHTRSVNECSACSENRIKRPLQAKFRIGESHDLFEQEADRVAEQVMKMPEPNQGNSHFKHVP